MSYFLESVVPVSASCPVRSQPVVHINLGQQFLALFVAVLRRRCVPEVNIPLGQLVRALATEYDRSVRILFDISRYEVHSCEHNEQYLQYPRIKLPRLD